MPAIRHCSLTVEGLEPLGRSSHERFLNGWYVALLLEHPVLVGLPVALVLGGYAHRARVR